ncbi:hypothetical protein [Oceanithermus sp.]|uniref:hypothetical protein n=1 Tax=Oceanithermus sp. TaxID=2268145 RepID=UPI00257F7B98|nr:hypothetical protein [Oceanithermus sp.]
MTKHIKVFVLFALALLASAQVYERPTEVVFEMTQLRYRPGVVYISPNYLTILVFDENVQRVLSSKETLMQAITKDNLVYLRAQKPAGQTDLVVYAGNQTLLFRVVVESETLLPRKYVIRWPLGSGLYYGVPQRPTMSTPSMPAPSPRPSTPTPSTSPKAATQRPPAPAPSAPPSSSTDGAPVQPEKADAGDQVSTMPPAPLPEPPQPASEAPSDQVAPTGNQVPEGVDFFARAARTREGAVAVTYTITNKSDGPLVFDSAQLEVLDDQGAPVKYQLIRLSTGAITGRLSPGETEESMIVVTAPMTNTLTIRWPVTRFGKGVTELLEYTVELP